MNTLSKISNIFVWMVCWGLLGPLVANDDCEYGATKARAKADSLLKELNDVVEKCADCVRAWERPVPGLGTSGEINAWVTEYKAELWIHRHCAVWNDSARQYQLDTCASARRATEETFVVVCHPHSEGFSFEIIHSEVPELLRDLSWCELVEVAERMHIHNWLAIYPTIVSDLPDLHRAISELMARVAPKGYGRHLAAPGYGPSP